MRINPGEVVICTAASFTKQLTKGNLYIVEAVSHPFGFIPRVRILGEKGWHDADRFRRVG